MQQRWVEEAVVEVSPLLKMTCSSVVVWQQQQVEEVVVEVSPLPKMTW